MVLVKTDIFSFHYIRPHCDLDLEDSNLFHTTLCPMVMHWHTKFGYKRFSSSEDMFWTKSDHRWTGRWMDRQTDRWMDRQNETGKDADRQAW